MTGNKELQEFIREKSAHLKYSKIEYEKRIEYAKAVYRNGVTPHNSNDSCLYRTFHNALSLALTEVEDQLELGRTVNKDRSVLVGTNIDLYFTKPKYEQEDDLARLSLKVKEEYKAELSAKRTELLDNLVAEYEELEAAKAQEAARQKMVKVKQQLSSLLAE